MIVRSKKSEQRIVQSRFLQTEKNWIGAIEGAETALGEPIARSSVWFGARWKAELQLLFAALFENAQNVSRIAQVETRQRFDERKNAMIARLFGRNRRVVDQPQWTAVGSVGLPEAIILQIKCAIII